MPSDGTPIDALTEVPSPIIPTGDNERMWTTWNEYIKGADQTFLTLAAFMTLHPNRMVRGMKVRVTDHPQVNTMTEYVLVADPEDMVDGNGDSIMDVTNFLEYFDQTDELNVTLGFERAYEYAPDGSGGGAPPFPYETDPAFEANWSPIYNASLNHKWIRFRDDNVDSNADDIFDNWTAPIPINQAYTSGDYIDIIFKRQVVSTVVHTSTATMSDTLYYIVSAGKIVNDITGVTHFKGAVFQYNSANTYTFGTSPAATCEETVQPIPRTKTDGSPNNDADPPGGWQDVVPGGTDQLWKATGQKSVYGQLKSSWIITKIKDNDGNYTRYSTSPSPHPDTLAKVDDDANGADPAGIALDGADWKEAFVANHVFLATRSDDQNPSSPKYTTWLVQKIAEESGEYIDRVFKLFPIGLDADSPLVQAPTARDATTEGWSDIPLEEPDNKINYYSESRKFFDGTLKSSWSRPYPYTGQDAYLDSITSDLGDDFKYDQDGDFDPPEIELTANLFRGTIRLWESADSIITYVWKKIYDAGGIVDVSPTDNSGDDFYKKAASVGAPGAGEFLADQRVGIKPGAVNGKAVFECTQSFDPGGGAPIQVFVETFSMLDITDGSDARSIAVRADSGIIIWDQINTAFAPGSIVLEAFQSNLLTGTTFYWYKHNGVSWIEFTVADANHTFPQGINGGTLTIEGVTGSSNAVPDIVFAAGAGADINITGTLPAMVVTDEFIIEDHSDPENNGLYEVITVNVSGADYEVSKVGVDATDPIIAVSEAVTLKWDASGLSKAFTTDAAKGEVRYAVTNTQADPDTADYLTKFSDFQTIVKLGSASTANSGENATDLALGNQAHIIVMDIDSLQPGPKQIGIGGSCVTTVRLQVGNTPLIYGTDYGPGNITVVTDPGSVDSDDDTDILFDYDGYPSSPNGPDFLVYVTEWNDLAAGTNTARSGRAKITVNYQGVDYTRYFSVSSALDAEGATILDIDCDTIFSFDPNNRSDKTFTANFIINGDLNTTDDYRYQWLLNGTQTPTGAKKTPTQGGLTQVVASTQVQGGAYLRCNVFTFPGDVLITSRQIDIQDITDAKRKLLYFNYTALQTGLAGTIAAPLSNPGGLSGTNPMTEAEYNAQNTTGSDDWGKTPGDFTYYISEGVEQDDKTWLFTTGYLIREEKGEQGLSGQYFREAYLGYNVEISQPSPPSTVSSSTQACGNGVWSFNLPTTCDVVWGSRRLYNADNTPASGSSWSSTYRLTGQDGTDGTDGVGTPGLDGLGWTGGSYNAGNGIVTFSSNDGLEFSTDDLRGGPGIQGPAGLTLYKSHFNESGGSITTLPLGSTQGSGSWWWYGTADTHNRLRIDNNSGSTQRYLIRCKGRVKGSGATAALRFRLNKRAGNGTVIWDEEDWKTVINGYYDSVEAYAEVTIPNGGYVEMYAYWLSVVGNIGVWNSMYSWYSFAVTN